MLEQKIEFVCEIKELTEDGSFRGVASVYGVEDLGGDIIDQGAFRKTLAENNTVPILWQHKPDEVIGEGVVKEWQNKILVEGKLDLEDPTGVKAYGKLKRRLVKGLSIGFQTLKAVWEEVEGRMVRHIGELKLWEVSIVTFPMLPDAQVTRVKAVEDEPLVSLKEQVSSLQSRLDQLISTTPQGAGKSGAGADEEKTQTPTDERHSAAAARTQELLEIFRKRKESTNGL